jgi:asparagine synthase (glutamine-hydrolysing)
MCGIAGEWDWNGRPCEQSAIAAMIGRLDHRGPEARACWLSSDGEIALAYTQLSFFKGGGAQPVSNARNSIFVVCNGEIYNHPQLADFVRQSGVAPTLRSDVEIIPYLYELCGTSSFSLLRGEFAFALYDSENQSLYLVRDRIGIKPLYFHLAASSILFASEIEALFAHGGVARKFNNASIATKLFGITLPGDTAFSDIREVKPGCYVKVAAGQILEQSY